MNGEIRQVCAIVAAAKKAMKEKSKISYIPFQYENKIEFQFLPERKWFSKPHRAENIAAWFDFCLKKGLKDILFLIPTAVKDRNFLGFSNTSQSSILCFYDNRTTYFIGQWEFDPTQNMWNILYSELEWENAPSTKPHFEDNTEAFKSILIEIKEFACKIECQGFAAIFQKAFDILSASYAYTDMDWEYDMPFPELPKENLRLFKAAAAAHVFGAMGSWNDSPPFLAEDKGMSKEYDYLSDELLKQINLALLYAVNAW